MEFNESLNILVGDNEAGKSTILEAIHLAISGQLNSRNIQSELTPYLFNQETVIDYLNKLKSGRSLPPPSIVIEVYFKDELELATLKGTNNSLKEDCPGIKLIIEFNDEFSSEYEEFIKSKESKKTIPIEYYKVSWFGFSNNAITSRSIPISTTLIDTSLLRSGGNIQNYVLKVISDHLSPSQRVALALSYRKLKDTFLEDPTVEQIHKHLKDNSVTDKNFTVSMDISSRSTWESGLTAHFDDIPFVFIGRGEQSSIKMQLAMDGSSDTHIFLVEEPENHLSYLNMQKLINAIGEKAQGKQIIITTHSSFVLNKLGVESVILFNRGKSMKLNNLQKETRDYFMKLPGHDTLRLILAQKAILVEGPSDELIVQRAYLDKHQKNSLADGVDVISVQSLAFKRFLEIGVLLDLKIRVVTDNDGDLNDLHSKYFGYGNLNDIKICYDNDTNYPTLEPQLLKANSLNTINSVLGKQFKTEDELLNYMSKHKTDCALQIFSSQQSINFPQYIIDAIT